MLYAARPSNRQSGRPPHGGRGLKWSSDSNTLGVEVSPSPRRAWIEIREFELGRARIMGRPPHGGRGLKSKRQDYGHKLRVSPSPRRAWIEIITLHFLFWLFFVALPTEGVD